MEYPIDRITNNQLDDIIVLSKFQYNSMSISLPYEYVSALIYLNWSDVLFALNNGFFSASSAVAQALNELVSAEHVAPTVMDLACMSFDETTYNGYDIYAAVSTLAQMSPEPSRGETEEKMLYVLLNSIYKARRWFVDPLQAIAIIYDDFGFPSSISDLVKYMPNKKNEMGLDEGGERYLFQRWKSYLEKKQELYTPQSLDCYTLSACYCRSRSGHEPRIEINISTDQLIQE